MLSVVSNLFNSPPEHSAPLEIVHETKDPKFVNYVKYVPEHVLEDHPIAKTMPEDFISSFELDEILSSDSNVQKKLLDVIHKKGFFAIDLPLRDVVQIDKLYQIAAEFLRKSLDEKQKIGEKTFDMWEWVGYHRISFENYDNRRDPEERDVFAIRRKYVDKMDWPSDPNFREQSLLVYDFLYDLGVKILKNIGQSINNKENEFIELLTNSNEKEITKESNPTTNFCIFRYFDDKMNYKKTQRCMIHQDPGLITLLPRATYPGLEIMDFKTGNWIQVEKFTKENQILVFFGESMDRITQGFIRATTHRVVREPHLERFSMPMEIQPNRDSMLNLINNQLIQNFKDSKKNYISTPSEKLFDEMYYHFAMCDHCDKNIFGRNNRHKCLDCVDYDLCQSCIHLKDSIHNKYHEFIKIDKLYDDERLKEKTIYSSEFRDMLNTSRSLRKMWRLNEMEGRKKHF